MPRVVIFHNVALIVILRAKKAVIEAVNYGATTKKLEDEIITIRIACRIVA